MNLNGQCKEDFENWFNEEQVFELGDINNGFYGMQFSCQYGVLVDYFDSVGIFCEDRRYMASTMSWVVKYPNFNGIQDRYDGLIKTRPEARKAAIEKANELYNNTNK